MLLKPSDFNHTLDKCCCKAGVLENRSGRSPKLRPIAAPDHLSSHCAAVSIHHMQGKHALGKINPENDNRYGYLLGQSFALGILNRDRVTAPPRPPRVKSQWMGGASGCPFHSPSVV